MFLIHRRDIIEPVEIRNILQVGARLHQLFGATMEEPNVRIDALDDFAVELENEPQNAMRGGMLRTPIEGEITDRIVAHVKSVLRRSSLRVALGLLVAWQNIVDRAFPWRQEVERPELLGEVNRLIEDALLLIVIAHLDIARHREILA